MSLPKNVRDALPNQPAEEVKVTEVIPGTGESDLGKRDGDALQPNPVGIAIMVADPNATNTWLKLAFDVNGGLPMSLVVGGNVVAVDGEVNIKVKKESRSDVFSGATIGGVLSADVEKFFALQVVATGPVTSWDMRLEGSLDAVNYYAIVQHTNVDGSGIIKFSSGTSPVLFFRARCAAIVLGGGTLVTATILGCQ